MLDGYPDYDASNTGICFLITKDFPRLAPRPRVTSHSLFIQLSGDKNIISLSAAKIAAFLFYGIKFLSKTNDKNFISFPTEGQGGIFQMIKLPGSFAQQLINESVYIRTKISEKMLGRGLRINEESNSNIHFNDFNLGGVL